MALTLKSTIGSLSAISPANTAEPVVSELLDTLITFPDNFPSGFKSAIPNTTYDDTTFSLNCTTATGTQIYMNGGYTLTSSSYGVYQANGKINTVRLVFDSNAYTYWGHYRTIANNRNGVNYPYTNNTLTCNDSGVYIGQTPDYYFTTNGYAGEWLQVEFSF
jgi:hypothetical protein